MAYSANYTTLKADILAFTEESSAEFDAEVDNIIALGESRVCRDLALQCMQAEVTAGSTVAGTRELARPASIVKTEQLYITSSGTTRARLKKRTYSYLLEYAPTIGTQAQPAFYAEKDDTNFYLVPTPNAIYVATAYGIVRPTALSGGHLTNWLSLNVPDLLLKACLIEAEQFLIADVPVAKWRGDYAQLLISAKQEYSHLSREDYVLGGGM